MIVYSVYFIGISIFNLSLKETAGKVTKVHKYEETSRSYGHRSVEIKTTVRDVFYQYNIDGTSYFGKRINNLLVFPDLDLYRNKNITVYYSGFFPKYSVLFKGNLEYFIYNLFPIIILGIIMHLIKTKNNLYERTVNKKDDDIYTNETSEETEDHDEVVEMEDIFIEELGKGENAVKFLLASNESDGRVIESLLMSEQIPYKIEYASVKLRSYRNSVFYILEKDYSDALIVINEYIRTKRQDEKDKVFIYKK